MDGRKTCMLPYYDVLYSSYRAQLAATRTDYPKLFIASSDRLKWSGGWFALINAACQTLASAESAQRSSIRVKVGRLSLRPLYRIDEGPASPNRKQLLAVAARFLHLELIDEALVRLERQSRSICATCSGPGIRGRGPGVAVALCPACAVTVHDAISSRRPTED